MNIKGIIFDYGGTIDTDGIHWGELLYMEYQKHAPHIGRELFRAAYVYGERTLAKTQIIMPDDTFQVLLEKKIALHAEFIAESGERFTQHQQRGIIDGCYQKVLDTIARNRLVLDKLVRDYPMVLVTNFYGNMPVVLKEFALEEYFVAVIESSVVGIRKPSPDLFKLGVEALKLQPEEVAVIGDSYRKDIAPAKSLGCTAIWVKNLCWEEEEILPDLQPDAIIASIEEVGMYMGI